jgi:hypothetical protein
VKRDADVHIPPRGDDMTREFATGVSTWAGLFALALLAVGCGPKPCSPVPASENVKRLGIVLDGGSLCKDEGNAVIVEYAAAGTDAAVLDMYSSGLGKAGWKTQVSGGGTALLTRDADTLFVATVVSKDSGLPTAVVRHCADPSCREQLTALAENMKKMSN